jgi:hypothetical protein
VKVYCNPDIKEYGGKLSGNCAVPLLTMLTAFVKDIKPRLAKLSDIQDTATQW